MEQAPPGANSKSRRREHRHRQGWRGRRNALLMGSTGPTLAALNCGAEEDSVAQQRKWKGAWRPWRQASKVQCPPARGSRALEGHEMSRERTCARRIPHRSAAQRAATQWRAQTRPLAWYQPQDLQRNLKTYRIVVPKKPRMQVHPSPVSQNQEKAGAGRCGVARNSRSGSSVATQHRLVVTLYRTAAPCKARAQQARSNPASTAARQLRAAHGGGGAAAAGAAAGLRQRAA
jgi:hypothetical protein